jgi:integrase/recombinase XerD
LRKRICHVGDANDTQRPLGLPVTDWPAPDRIALNAAFARESRFRRGPAADWAPATRCAVTEAVGRWLGFLHRFEPSALAEPPLDRVTEDRLTNYVAHLSETVGLVGRHLYLGRLQKAFRVMFPGKVPEILTFLVAQLNRECRPGPKIWVPTQQLVALGKEMMQEAAGDDSELGKVLYRDGLMIMLWALRPERRRGFAQIRIGQQLRRIGHEWRLIFAAGERKPKRPSQMSVPKTVVSFLERYLEHVRPQFPDAHKHDALWLGMKGRPLSPHSISRLVARRTEAAFGHRIPPHRFRHCAASTVAVAAPGQIGLAARLLDHASLKTTYDHYILARSIEASRHYAKIIHELTPRRSRR